ncbi:acyclic terpene utilization AtuA family protein [Halocella sp. SP3-1]|uniref:acyclic terpene utilization AtuA family protein n=1 Tax=Halocella sp. SP3-1 TaxID=2382161 RepID=UPI000F7652BF|nr:acyclic terpene utilization AtuA family protein [Halocella sp. SP3-1]AZO95897.1 acyclic terpene utilization AtuA family protein [Halocella sp. SP3-1]
MEEIRVLAPTAILGYGFPLESFNRGLKYKPDIIAVDAGSTDPGPYYLGSGNSFTDREAVKRDLRIMIKAAKELNIPVLVGTAGGSGGRPHLEWCKDIVVEIAQKEGLNLTVALINAEFDKDYIVDQYNRGNIEPLYPVAPLDLNEIISSTRIVGQMGIEPIIKALDREVDVILAGRAYDPTVFAAPAVKAGFPEGISLHMGKILECASIAADPGSGSDCMLGILRKDSFILEPLNKKRKCTETSVAAHTLYEKSNPYELLGPGGIIDLRETKFKQIDNRRVEVKGSRFVKNEKYTIKLEGAKMIGYRTISIAGTRDPIMIEQIDSIIADVKEMAKENFANIKVEDYQLFFRVYGKNGVMGDLEPKSKLLSHELGIIIEAIALTQELANTICSFTRSAMLHYGYDGRIATAGNLAFPYSPSDIKTGEVYQFNINHLLEIDNPVEAFPLEIIKVGGENDG